MNLTELFLDSHTGLLRAGWRAAIFVTLLFSPYWVVGLFIKAGPAGATAVFDVTPEMVMSYALLIAWVVAVSWFCLRFLERLKLSALGYALYGGWLYDLLKGGAAGALMVASILVIQVLGGGTKLALNPVWRGERGIDWTGARLVAANIALALILLILAGAFEELVYRGYAFQTLLRGAPAYAAISVFSLFFGLAHLKNPDRTLFSTMNTVLAGIWLAVAYLRTRGLWFPTALHFTWNWTLGALFGVPVSGLRIPQHSILVSSNVGPSWLTGGNYGSEGGAAATLVLLIAIVIIWRSPWLRVSPDMNAALQRRTAAPEEAIRLGLGGPD
jgi:membrane protease YdiL (CAAX protease family)